MLKVIEPKSFQKFCKQGKNKCSSNPLFLERRNEKKEAEKNARIKFVEFRD